tara:strand:+ start:372 stop:623 length:252 start_codon:yes stop_codon:yes gene_type:complete
MSRIFKNSDSKTNNKLFETWNFSKKNYIIFFSGLIFIISGYVIMINGETNSFQSLTLAPILLFFGYIVIIPIALIIKHNDIDK